MFVNAVPIAPPPPPPAAAGRPLRRLLRPTALLALAAIVATLAFDRGGLFLVGFVFVLVVPFEKLFPRHPQRIRRPQVGTDIAHAIVATPLSFVVTIAAVVLGGLSLLWLPGLLLRPFVLSLPGPVAAVLGFVLFDLLVYWVHRFGHEVPFLWRFHSVHHSTEHLDWVSGFRSHPVDGAFFAPAFLFLLAAGFTAQVAGVFVVIQIIIGLFLHANVRWRWRPLHKVVITPEFHHWHHANEADAHNTNYSVGLPIWDLVFGTYFMPADRRPSRYGVTPPVPAGLAAQLWHPMRGLRNPLRALRHPILAARHLARLVRRGVPMLVASARRTPWRTPLDAWRRPRPTLTPF
jgi:sterol desaturase/sphingolipid hydroxylase (fatty acid hydroxylase superfamily)